MKYSYKIDTKLLPKVFVTWESTKNGAFNKRYWLNCQTGTKKETPESWMHYEKEADIYARPWNAPTGSIGMTYRTMKNDAIWVKSGTAVRYAYAKYHKGIDMLEVAAVGIKTTRAAEPHPWEYLGDRFFIDRNKNIVDQNGNTVNRYEVYQYHTAWNPNTLLSTLARLNYNDHVVNEFKKFIGANYFSIGNRRCISITYFWHIQEWYKTSQKPRGKGKEQKLADMLTEIPLSDTTGFADKYPVEVLADHGYCNSEIRHIMYFERVPEADGWSVLRQLHRNGNNELDEVCRIYIHDNGRNRIVAPSNNGWVLSTQSKHNYYSYYQLVNKEEAMAKCPRLKYALEALTDMEREKIADALISVMKWPEIEQFLKLGYTRAAKCMINNNTAKADIKRFFGDYYNDREKSILKKVGMTKRQLDFFMEKLEPQNGNRYYYADNVKRALSMMRGIFGNDLSYLDDESFQRYLNGFVQIHSNFWGGISDYITAIGVDSIRFVKNLIRLGEKREEIYRVMNDTLNAYTSLNYGTAPEVDWYFDDCSDVVRLHDALTALRNQQNAERRAMWNMAEAERLKKEEAKRLELDKERKVYEYEDDEYIIRLPKDAAEIVREGSMQSICIGGYTSRHSRGETNLFFLRRKSDPELPFYAIEMNNAKNIVQIHGSCNKWLGNDPEAIPTVVRWLRKNDIKCDDKILTCTARGYGRTNDYVPMPVVD